MIKRLLDILNGWQAPIRGVIILAAGVLFISLLYFHYHVIVAPYPHEYREGALVVTTQQLLDQVNPYALDEQPQHTNVYGALYNLLVYPLAKVGGATLPVHRVVTALFLVLIIWWLAAVMRKESIPAWLAAVGIVIYYAQTTSLFTVIARPDALGTFLFLSAVLLPWIGKFRAWPLFWSAVLFVLSFYTKLYFIISLPIVALYVFLFRDKVRALAYFVFSLGLLIVSAIAVNHYFPLYLSNTFYYYLAVGNSFGAGLWHVARQLAYFGYKNFGLALVFLILAGENLYWQRSGLRQRIKDYVAALIRSLFRRPTAGLDCDYIWFVFFCTSAAFVLKLGHNTGGFVDYIYQLITPFMMIIVWRWLAQRAEQKRFALYGLLLIAGLIFTFFDHRVATDYSREWRIIEDKMAGYQEVFNEPALTAIMVKQKKYVYDSGHSNAYLGDGLSRSPLYPDIQSRLRAYDAAIQAKIARQEFSAIVFDDYSYDMISRDQASQYYQPVATLMAPMIINSWVLEIWEPRPTVSADVVINKYE